MKLSQLMPAGDYLPYKGDWVNGTEYHENDVVTWGTDGHLYKVIKAHTSSSTIDPSNTEYYKAKCAVICIDCVFDVIDYGCLSACKYICF